MKPIERAALGLLACAVALASSATVLVLQQTGVISIPKFAAGHQAEPAPTELTAYLAKLDGRHPTPAIVEPPQAPLPLRLEPEATPESVTEATPGSEPAPETLQATPESEPAPAEVKTPALPEEAEAETETSSWSSEVITQASPPSAGTRLSAVPPQSPQWQNPDVKRTYTLDEKIAEISPTANRRITAKFDAAKVAWPPVELGLVAIKDEKVLELHARSISGEWQFVHRYPVLAASGTTGPKLRQGDKQVPEGVYGISFLNPNSKYHVALRVDYPNTFDKQMAAKDGRKKLGGDIMIHGKNASVGCLAVGDEAAEDLFVLAASIGLPKIKLVIAPTDFRKTEVPAAQDGHPKWLPKLYKHVASEMSDFKAPPSTSLLSLIGL